MTKRIVLIEDDTDLLALLKYNLEKEGFIVTGSQTGRGALDLCRRVHPDLILLDIMLPDSDGLDICKGIRNDSELAQTPIIFLTARASETDRIVGLELGANDYIVKPFFIREVIARIRLQFRTQTAPSRLLKAGGLELDRSSCQVKLGGENLALTATEFRLLEFLMTRPGCGVQPRATAQCRLGTGSSDYRSHRRCLYSSAAPEDRAGRLRSPADPFGERFRLLVRASESGSIARSRRQLTFSAPARRTTGALCYADRVATDLIEIHPLEPSPEALDRAAAAIRRGRVVAVPTDALYALVADPFNLRAVRQVYQAKGREIHRALPMLVRDTMMAEELARDISPRFKMLTRRFWPGPLTIIMPASPKVPLRATGNTGRLAVRQAQSTITDELIARLNQPIIATSANISGRPTCRTGIEVFGVMDGSVDLVLDGGACEGIGASTVDITELDWRVIKEGAITEREIADCLEAAEE